MATPSQNILSLESDEVMDFLLKSEQYHTFELPEYFCFDNLLSTVRNIVADKSFDECLSGQVTPDECANVNADIQLNKDGHYAIRPLVLANPILYYLLVREMCCAEGWPLIRLLFDKFKVDGITSCALPVVPLGKEPFRNSATIFNWWTSMEQRSIELSLEYRYMFITDIANCYGSINLKTLEDAFCLKNTSLESKDCQAMAANIVRIVKAFQHGDNVGIPQGSSLFDLLAEVLLGYSDLLLHEAIESAQIGVPYHIIRYRDDYRIFCNDRDKLEQISFILQNVLGSIGLRINSQKTKLSDSIVTDSVKPDKLFYIYNTPIFNKKGADFDSFEKHLLYILLFSRDYPNGGQLRVMLSDIDKRIKEYVEKQEKSVITFSLGDILDDDEKGVIRGSFDIDDDNSEPLSGDLSTDEDVVEQTELHSVADLLSDEQDDLEDDKCEPEQNLKSHKTDSVHIPGGSIRAMAAVCAQIAQENVTCAHYALRVLSRLVDTISDDGEKRDIIELVYAKLCNLPNSDYNQLWLQNMTYGRDCEANESPYTLSLCRVVAGHDDVQVWNNDWASPEIRQQVGSIPFVDKEALGNLSPVIAFRESRAYYDF